MAETRTAIGRDHVARRSAARLRLHLPARMTLIRGSHDCLIENISATGAQMLTENPPSQGDLGQLRCEFVDAFFEVIWRAGNLVGVEFDENLTEQDVLALRQLNDSYSEIQKMEIRRTARRWVNGELR